MREITLEELLEAGCHFGHQVTRQNPKARDFVFEARDNIHIIDLAKTKEGLDEATAFVKNLASREGSSIIVVGTKRQAQNIVEEEVKRARLELGENQESLFYVTNRWIGGLLTNFGEVAKNFKKLRDFGELLGSEQAREKYTKKELSLWAKEKVKLEGFYGGVKDMKKVPDAMFIIDTHLEDLAVREATRTDIPSIGIVDTNADPDSIKYPIPANDDAVGSLKLIISFIIDSWIEGKKNQEKKQVETPVKQEAVEEVKEIKKEKTAKKAKTPKENKAKVSKTSKKAA